MRVRPWRIAGALLLACLLITAAACSNSKSNTSTSTKPGATCTSPNETQGVSKTEIRVGGLASNTNPLGTKNGDWSWGGAQAYFDMVNSQGGVFGRKLKLAVKEDDQTGNNTQAAQRLVSQDNVFAVAPVASLLFTGANILAQACMPTFGWNINPQWSSGPSLFGEKGSHIKFDAPQIPAAWLAQKLHKTKVGILGYSIEESKKCAEGAAPATFQHYKTGAKVAFTDAAVPYPVSDLSGDVSAMKSKGVDFLMPCVDVNGMGTIAKEMSKQNFKPTMFLPDGYYPEIAKDPNFEGDYASVLLTPLEVQDPPPGLKDFLKWAKKDGVAANQLSVVGWVAADMLVTAIKKAGKNFTRSKVVAALNGMKDYTADGVLPPIDWTIAHTDKWNPPCSAIVQVHDGKFVPKFTEPGKPFLCFSDKTPAGQPAPEPTHK